MALNLFMFTLLVIVALLVRSSERELKAEKERRRLLQTYAREHLRSIARQGRDPSAADYEALHNEVMR